jgi:hypothetical protein
MTAPVSTGNAVPPFPVAANIVPIRLIVYTNATKHVAYLNAIARDSVLTLQRIDSMFASFTQGAFRSNVDINTNGVNGSVTATLASVVATNTIVINGVTLTASATGNGTTTFTAAAGVANATAAANLAACINANTTLLNQVYATALAAVVTITCRIPGTLGNLMTFTQTGGTITLSAASPVNGVDGTQSNISHGL